MKSLICFATKDLHRCYAKLKLQVECYEKKWEYIVLKNYMFLWFASLIFQAPTTILHIFYMSSHRQIVYEFAQIF